MEEYTKEFKIDIPQKQKALKAEIVSFLNKDIAKKLGHTRASISFHTQKLLNSGLLELVMDDDSVKYMVNKELIRKIIEKFKQDLT